MQVSPLPSNPTAVFTVRRSVDDEFDSFIVVSFTNATLVRPWTGCLPLHAHARLLEAVPGRVAER